MFIALQQPVMGLHNALLQPGAPRGAPGGDAHAPSHHHARQASYMALAQAKPIHSGSAAAQFQPQQWGMVPSTMPSGQQCYIMLPLAQLAHLSAATPAHPSLPQLAPSAHAPPRAITPLPQLRAHSPTARRATQAAKPPPLGPLDDWRDADMLRVFLGYEEEAAAPWALQRYDAAACDTPCEMDALFASFDEQADDLTFAGDLGLSSCAFDLDDPFGPPDDHSADSGRTCAPFGAAEDDSASASPSSAPLRPQRRIFKSQSERALKVSKGGVSKAAASSGRRDDWGADWGSLDLASGDLSGSEAELSFM